MGWEEKNPSYLFINKKEKNEKQIWMMVNEKELLNQLWYLKIRQSAAALDSKILSMYIIYVVVNKKYTCIFYIINQTLYTFIY